MSIIVENLTHIYNPKSPFETIALSNVNFTIERGEFVGLIGHTGSGKSTLIQHLNGLLKPTSGKILINGLDITSKDVKLNEIRKKVGLVFQYPEYQLFEETVFKDIAFGPINLGLSEKEINNRVREAITLVGLDYENIKDRSPFELSGGQRRRVAIAGVIAMKPEVLILDEPTAGLDPRGREEILKQIKELHDKYDITVILVSHSMEDIARLADKIIVMDKGKIALIGSPREIFRQAAELEKIGLGIPQITYLVRKLREIGIDIRDDIFTIEEAKYEIIKLIRGKKNA
ncbi:energy-coupling factor transport system ATP-binding protein [Caminicella sporogenes DSM 14501]|uniref:Energy-coupling factor transporter ATP-binding protein EcfA2 n=1 Tax=Caminicella sporogenes DSM 14501 TaxID=1121266 RepID=A0A1M6TDN4_9FIRM|nr:energy-coupling factor transporter ATPase [Caminicella sporogenes]RKD25408.1 energy-coupling factor transporter ATPase [Caminicella sporogenes]WIF95561.1 energy-coupling factor transporter ATPase [Caminicella sporogenes]SHK54936.1 energy-coupling factor transport system ATP-binding protein [Caminicella sporogenes DSM 14501]